MSGQPVIKTPIGSFVPDGWSILKTTRSGQYIQKKSTPVQKDEMDNLLSAFKAFGIAATAANTADIEMEGGRRHRKSKRHTRKSRKTRRHRA